MLDPKRIITLTTVHNTWLGNCFVVFGLPYTFVTTLSERRSAIYFQFIGRKHCLIWYLARCRYVSIQMENNTKNWYQLLYYHDSNSHHAKLDILSFVRVILMYPTTFFILRYFHVSLLIRYWIKKKYIFCYWGKKRISKQSRRKNNDSK